MTNQPSTDSRFDEILATRSAEVASLARRVQALVRDTLPDLDWVPNHGQEGIGFGVDQYGHDGWGVGAIGVAKNWVTLGFMRGAQLPDPHGIVEGTGRNVRHVKVRTAQAFEERKDALVMLLRAATGVSAPPAVQGALDLGEVDEPVRHSALSAERSQVGRAAQGARLAAQASTAQASTAQASKAEPATKKPAAKKPVAKKPVAKKPAAKKPATKKPATKKPAAKKPATKKPAAKKPATKKPATKKPVAKKPAAKKPATKKPAAKKPAAKKPTAKKPTAKKPATKKPTAKKPTAKKPATKKPAAKKPTAKKPATKKPAANRPAGNRPVAKKTARR